MSVIRAYTVLDLPQLKIWLLEAYEARRLVALGQRVQSAGYEGKTVTYSSGNADTLSAWINDLNDTIAFLEGRRRRRGPLLVNF